MLLKLMKKSLSGRTCIIIIVLVILILFVLFYYFGYSFWKSKRVTNYEHFGSSSSQLVQYPRNFITNGIFANGKKPDEYVSQSGSNQIISMKNPTGSGYVLKQSKTSPATLTYYELQTYCDNNSKYLMTIWTSFSNNSTDNKVEDIDLSKILNVRVLKTDGTNYIPQINYKIMQKVELEDDIDTWYLVQYNWSIPNDTDNLQNIDLNYTDALQSDNQYFVGLTLYKVLPEAPNFIFNDKLNLYLDGYHTEANSRVWNDVSTFGNDLSWSSNPFINSSGSVNTNNNILSGRTSKQILGDSDSSFTFNIVMQTTSEDNDISGLSELSGDDDNNTSTILTIPGNNSYSLRLVLDKSTNTLILKLPNNKMLSSNAGLVLNNETMISIIYTTGGKIKLYQDGNIIIDDTCDILYYSSTDQIQINPNKDLNINLYAILNYERVVSVDELNKIRQYFITQQNKDFHSLNSNDLTFDSSFYKKEWNSVSAYNKRDPSQSYINDNMFNTQYTNQSYLFQTDKKYCLPQANSICQAFMDDTKRYQECMRNARNVIPSCKNYCDDSANKNSLICEIEEKCGVSNQFDAVKDCPNSYKRFGEYMVYIKPDSYYANEMQYSGEKSYGKNLENARTMYQMNFPKCPLPSNLKPGEGKNTLDRCPYIIHEGNPCYQTSCAGIDWSESNYKNINMNDKCKKSISYYCQINADLDDMCKCWRDEYKDNSKCIEYKKFFENPKDYCPVSSFNIEDHPNINQYIKKDNIPCFGCKL